MVLVAVLAALLTSACAHQHVEEWTGPPLVAWKDLAADSIPSLGDEYKILVSQPTKGLFPARMAVMRVARTPTGRLQLVRDPRNEFLQWNSAFDDQMAVSEVFPIAQRDLAGADATRDHLLAANRALHAGIGLSYAFNELAENDSEMIGLLYNTEKGTPIAVFHAQATSLITPEQERHDDPVDLWKTDSHALVRMKFERIVYNCLRDLIQNDLPADVEAPEGWTPIGPIMPVEWPPRLHR